MAEHHNKLGSELAAAVEHAVTIIKRKRASSKMRMEGTWTPLYKIQEDYAKHPAILANILKNGERRWNSVKECDMIRDVEMFDSYEEAEDHEANEEISLSTTRQLKRARVEKPKRAIADGEKGGETAAGDVSSKAAAKAAAKAASAEAKAAAKEAAAAKKLAKEEEKAAAKAEKTAADAMPKPLSKAQTEKFKKILAKSKETEMGLEESLVNVTKIPDGASRISEFAVTKAKVHLCELQAEIAKINNVIEAQVCVKCADALSEAIALEHKVSKTEAALDQLIELAGGVPDEVLANAGA